MLRSYPALLAAALLAGTPAYAQDQPLNIYFQPIPGGDVASLNKAIEAALSQQPMQLVARPFAGVLVVSVPDRVQVEHKQVSGTVFSFTVAFSRDGSPLGESAQSCNAGKLSDCTDQLVQDVKSVTAQR